MDYSGLNRSRRRCAPTGAVAPSESPSRARDVSTPSAARWMVCEHSVDCEGRGGPAGVSMRTNHNHTSESWRLIGLRLPTHSAR